MTDAVHKLGEVLRAAREAKGVDLPRVERETKIRERYLSALERGEYRELPGAVYTKGFLRNYGTYLGLDPEYLIDLYRIETSDARGERPAPAAPPRPIGVRRTRGFVVTPGAVVAAILTLAVGGFFAYLGYELVNFAREPELRITEPAGNVNGHTELTIAIRGVTEPNARVTVSNLTENPTVTADAAGSFEIVVQLVPGSNVVRLEAYDSVTNRTSPAQERTIIVVNEVAASPSAGTALSVDAPSGEGVLRGPVTVSGRAAAGGEVTVTASLQRPPTPTFEITDGSGAAVEVTVADPRAPEPVTLAVDGGGAFTGTIELAPGAWRLTIASAGATVSRDVAIGTGDGLSARLTIGEGGSYLELDEDGEPLDGTSGTIVAEGDTITASADETLRVRAGNAGAVRLSVNGITIGAMGDPGAVIEWQITRDGG
ncbi:MAG TPA: RodZ domain-containing protein [Candidatus Limnocylindria bacterium]